MSGLHNNKFIVLFFSVALIQPSQAADESGFVGHAQHGMDKKGRIIFPKKNIVWNGRTYPREDGLTPMTQTVRSGKPRAYLFHPSSLHGRMVLPSLGLIRHPNLEPDHVGRLLVSKALRDIIGDTRDKLFIGAGPYCILTNASDNWQTELASLLLPDETVHQLLSAAKAANGHEVVEISDFVRGLVETGAVNAEIDLEIGGVRVHGNLHLSREHEGRSSVADTGRNQ